MIMFLGQVVCTHTPCPDRVGGSPHKTVTQQVPILMACCLVWWWSYHLLSCAQTQLFAHTVPGTRIFSAARRLVDLLAAYLFEDSAFATARLIGMQQFMYMLHM